MQVAKRMHGEGTSSRNTQADITLEWDDCEKRKIPIALQVQQNGQAEGWENYGSGATCDQLFNPAHRDFTIISPKAKFRGLSA